MKNHLQVLFFAIFALICVYSLEFKFSNTPGLYVGALEVLLECLALIISVFSHSAKRWTLSQNWCLRTFFATLLIGDAFYVYFYYIKQVGHPTPVISYLTSMPYCFSFLTLFLFFTASMKSPLKKHIYSPLAIIPFLILTPIAVKLAAPLFLLGIFDSPFKLIEIATLLSSYLVFIFALLIFLNSKEVFWTHFSSGVLIFMFSDWAIKVEKFMGHEIKFVGYEFLWAFGVTLVCFTVLFETPKDFEVKSFDYRSIALNSRLISLLIALTSLLLVLLSQQEVELIKFITVSSTLGVLGSATLSQYHFDQLELFSKSIADILESNKEPGFSPADKLPRELESSFRGIVQNKISELKENERKAARMYLAMQVAHDIRSPLAVLDLLSNSKTTFPEEFKVVAQAAIKRIREIANNILNISRDEDKNCSFSPIQTEPASVQLISILVEEIVNEKSAQMIEQKGITFSLVTEIEDYEAFAMVQPTEFKRMMSNLINNGFESIKEKGSVQVKIKGDSKSIFIEVNDTGRGIPMEIFPKLMKKGETFGKSNGNGLGLFHAKNCCESWGGSINLQSQLGVGTKVEITLPKSNASMPTPWRV